MCVVIRAIENIWARASITYYTDLFVSIVMAMCNKKCVQETRVTYLGVKAPLRSPPLEGHHGHVEQGHVRPEALADLHVPCRGPLNGGRYMDQPTHNGETQPHPIKTS